jgi:hypothetical protein
MLEYVIKILDRQFCHFGFISRRARQGSWRETSRRGSRAFRL